MRLNPYESKRYLNEYLLLHYGRPSDVCPFPFIPPGLLRFHERLREEYLLLVQAASSVSLRLAASQQASGLLAAPRPLPPSPPTRRVGRPGKPEAYPSTAPSAAGASPVVLPTRGLDLGCAVGRFTFELGRVVSHVLGLDNSRTFIQAARRMAQRHELVAKVQESGARFSARRLVLPGPLRQSHVEFRAGDALDLSALPDGAFQVVSAINLICRVRRPRQFLRQLARLLAPGGQLLIASPFSWLEEYSAPNEWLTEEALCSLLRSEFRLVRQGDVPLVIREHRRKYELVISKAFTFVRRD